ncbi:hypothetical protein JOC36_001037 [Weissella uvarum]|uniref:DUF6731 family protein n=1 Tax=Weissella uvarum TaxID=1479233 RepID=UPI001961FEDF|nr:DUF6731 family protein [Weissella uvarum]MBM7617480.1 hypothetical protein [Weissella uvarum]MCM0595636.1 hypothetical protein [Weissella uvarum]
MGNYVLRLDKISKDKNNKFLRMHFQRLSHKDLAQSRDDRAGSEELKLRDDHTYISDGAVLIIDMKNNRGLFQVNGKSCRMPRVEEYINHFWHINGNGVGSFQFWQMHNDVDKFIEQLKTGRWHGTKKIDLKLSNHSADIPDKNEGDPINGIQQYTKAFQGTTAQLIISKGHGQEYLNDTAVSQLVNFVSENPERVKKAQIEYMNEDERPSLLDLMDAKKRVTIEVSSTDSGYVNLDEVETALIFRYNSDFPDC